MSRFHIFGCIFVAALRFVVSTIKEIYRIFNLWMIYQKRIIIVNNCKFNSTSIRLFFCISFFLIASFLRSVKEFGIENGHRRRPKSILNKLKTKWYIWKCAKLERNSSCCDNCTRLWLDADEKFIIRYSFQKLPRSTKINRYFIDRSRK